MGTISFSDKPDEIWYVAGWIFWQVLDDVISQYPEDLEIAKEFEFAKINSGLSIDLLEPDLSTRITTAIRQVATGVLSGTIRSGIYDQPYGDSMAVEEYQKMLQQLLEIFSNAKKE